MRVPNLPLGAGLAAGLAATFAAFGPPRTAQAQELEPAFEGARLMSFEGARLLSYAGALRALSTSNDAIYLNPAGLALSNIYSIEGNFLDDLRGRQRFFNASVMDSQAGPVAGGLAYTYMTRTVGVDPQGAEYTLEGHRAELSVATKVAETVAIGVTGRYLNFTAKHGEADDPARAIDIFTIDAGLQWRSQSGFCLGLAAYNLTKPDYREVPISWGAGLGFEAEGFAIEADIRYNARIGKAAFSGAVAYAFGGVVPIRLGGSYDLASQSASISAGIGYQTKEFSADFGFRQRVSEGRYGPDDLDGARMIGLSLRLMIPQSQ